MKKRNLFCVAMLSLMMMTACEKNETVKDENESVTTEAVKQDNKEKAPVIQVEELIIKNGENDVFGKIFYPTTEGKHPAIIMCHGYNGSHADFVNECKYFASNGYIAYALDFCGSSNRSKSSGKTTDMTIFTEKEDLLAVFDYISAMDEVDSEQVYLFGGSQGGLVASLAAEERADKVKGMILYFPAFNIPDNWRQNFPDVNMIPETYDFWGVLLGRKFFADMHDFYTFDNIGNFKKNILIVQGDQDTIAPLAASQYAATLYENAELVVLPGEGHGFTPSAAKTAMMKTLKFMQEH